MSVCFIGWHACWRCARAAGSRPSGWVVWIGDADRQWIQIQVWWPLVWRCACGWPRGRGALGLVRAIAPHLPPAEATALGEGEVLGDAAPTPLCDGVPG